MLRSAAYLGIFLLTSLLPLTASLQAQSFGASEEEVKAAFIYNFLKYIEFPKANPSSANIALCIISNERAEVFNQQLEGKAIATGQLHIVQLDAHQPIDGCDVLFVRASVPITSEAMEAAGKKGKLVIGESQGFITQGALINFYLNDFKVRFEINPKRASALGFKISSKLIALAKVVDDPL